MAFAGRLKSALYALLLAMGLLLWLVALLLFAQYLPRERISQLLDDRLDQFGRMLELARPVLEGECQGHAGSLFAAGLCDAMMRAGLDYIHANREWLEAAVAEDTVSARGTG